MHFDITHKPRIVRPGRLPVYCRGAIEVKAFAIQTDSMYSESHRQKSIIVSESRTKNSCYKQCMDAMAPRN